MSAVSVLLSSAAAPEVTLGIARDCDDAGISRLWITEDYFLKGGIAVAGAVLGATSRLRVGIGVLSSLVRHPALTAMELATLDRLFPQRLLPGIGLGSVRTLDRIGLRPEKIVGAVGEQIRILRALLEGQTVSTPSPAGVLTGVELEVRPTGAVPIAMAAGSPQMLRLAARSADMLILSILSGPSYARWVAETIADIERDRPIATTAFVYLACADDREAARARARTFLGSRLKRSASSPMIRHSSVADEVLSLLDLEPAVIAERLSDAAVDEFVVVGTPGDCAARAALFPTDEVALTPIPDASGTYDYAPAVAVAALAG